MQRREVHYAGRVQGVGFRYTTERLARNFSVAGFVRNLSDGRVQLVAEGSPQELDALLDAISAAMQPHITGQQVEIVGPNHAQHAEILNGFEVRY